MFRSYTIKNRSKCFTGGRAWSESATNGEGGSSFIPLHIQHWKEVKPGVHYGPGSVMIIPATIGCECEYRCVALDEDRAQGKCMCPPGWHLAQDNKSCVCKCRH